MRFRELIVRIQPSYVQGNIELSFKVKTDGNEINYIQVIRQDHFESYFSQVWGEAYHDIMRRLQDQSTTDVKTSV